MFSLLLLSLISVINSIRPYVFIETPKTYADAQEFCSTQFGTDLATISSSVENTKATQDCSINGEVSRCWIGLNDIDIEGTFEWIEGKPVIFRNFFDGEPNNSGNEDCVELRQINPGFWNDLPCDQVIPFLCNAPSPTLFAKITKSLAFNEFRTIDGTGNNLNNPFGIHNGPIIRTTPNGFEDGMSSRARPNEKSARIISNIVSDSPNADLDASEVGLSNLAWLFGQFMDHELVEQTASMEDIPETRIDETEICIPIPVNDPFFLDPSQECVTINDNAQFSANDPVQRQINIVTSFIDGSAVYGSENDRAPFLRNTDGTLKTTINNNGDINLPFNTFGLPNSGGESRQDLFIAGDPRVNENIALTAMHTLWVRNHNYLVNEIRNENPFLTGDELYEYARLVNGALIQHITYNEWLPALYGKSNVDLFFDTNTPYDDTCDASVAAHFSFVAFRVGHTLISDGLAMKNSLCQGTDSTSLLDAFTRPDIIKNGERVVDKLLMGLSCTAARKIDPFIINTLRNLLQFNVNNNTDPMDLMAINIERGRDDGIADYATLRESFGLLRPTSFTNPPDLFLNLDIRNRIQTAYDDNINNIDPIVGAFSETHLKGAAFGELIAKEWQDQFQRAINCDRFFYKRYLTKGLLKYVRSTTMKNVIQQNSNPRIEFLPNHQFVFNSPGQGLNELITFIPIRNFNGGLCLDVPFNDPTNNNPIILNPCVNSNSQEWYYNTKSKEIVHSSGKCLSVRSIDFETNIDRARIVIFDCNNQENQKWILDSNDINNHIRNFLGMCLQSELDQSFVPGAAVSTSTCIFPGIPNQNWVYFGEKLNLVNGDVFSA